MTINLEMVNITEKKNKIINESQLPARVKQIWDI